MQLIKEKLRSVNVRYKLLENPGRSLAKGWNIGIQNASGKFITRPDAHAILEPGYISKAISLLERMPEVGVVGGTLETKANTFKGKLIMHALSMRTGVGNSSFRTGENSGYKDTAVYGIYRREVFEKVGLFNEQLNRHQDTEFHYRVINCDIQIYLHNEMKAIYFCRDSFRSIGKQMFDIGYNFSNLLRQNAGESLRPRHWIPLFFYSGLLLMLILGLMYKMMLWLFCIAVCIYFTAIIIDAFSRFYKAGNLFPFASVFIIPFIHFNYAAGTFCGLISLAFGKK